MSAASTPPTPDAPVYAERDAAGVVTIVFNRPEVHNAMNFAAMERLAQIVEALHGELAAAHAGPRVVILTGAGTAAFSSGGDQQELHALPGAEHGARLATVMGDALHAVERLPVPVIAAVNGYALGGGSEIALACDLRVVAEDARLGLVHAGLGLIPGWGGAQRLMRLVGYARAMEMMLSARPYGAAELHAMGVVNTVAPAGAALAAARDLAARVAALDPATVRAVKGALQDGWRMPYDEALRAERARFPALWAADAHQDAVRRFLARRGKDQA